MATYTIRPLNCGLIHSRKREYWGGRLTGTRLYSVSIMWLIEGGPFPIVVDASFHSVANAKAGNNWVCERSPEQEPLAQFKKVGVDPNDVRVLLLTHMHWDHDGCLHLFPNAKKYVWRRELQYWASPCRTQAKPFEAPSHPSKLTAPWVQHRVTFIPLDDVTEVLPGIVYFPMPGHTIGECGVSVKAESGTYAICGDLINRYPGPDRPLAWPELPTHQIVGQTYSLPDAYKSVREVMKYASSPKHILPSHEAKNFDVEVFR